MKKSSKSNVVLSILIGISLLANGILFVLFYQGNYLAGGSAIEPSSTERYVLYIGISDKDTQEEKLTIEEAAALVSDLCFVHTDSFTYIVARGAWMSDHNTQFFENTLIYFFYDVDEASMSALMDDILVQLNQESILVERQLVDAAFYP